MKVMIIIMMKKEKITGKKILENTKSWQVNKIGIKWEIRMKTWHIYKTQTYFQKCLTSKKSK